MDSERPVSAVIDSFMAGQMSRRQFIARLTAFGLSVGAIGTLLAACATAETPASAGTGGGAGPWAADPKSLTGTIKIYKGPFAANEPDLQKPFIERYKANFCPNVNVEFSMYDWTTAEAQMTASLANGDHDMYYIPEVFYGKYPVKDGPVEDLEPWIADPKFKEITKNFLPGYLMRPKPPTGVLGGVAWVDGAQAMIFINLDLFEKAGVDPAAWATSYDTMTDAARKIQALGPDVSGIQMRENGAKNFGWFEWYGYMLRAGTDFLNGDFSAPAINTPEFAAALQMIQDWHVKDKVMPEFGKYNWDGIRAQFIAGKVGILLDEPFFAGVIDSTTPAVPFKWDVSKYPPGPKADVMLSNAGLWVMSAKSQNKQATWEAIKSWTIPDKDYMKAVGTTPIISNWKEEGWWADDPRRASLQQLLPFTHGPILHEQLLQFKTICEPFFDDVYAGKKSPTDALAAASDQIAAALKTGA
jgi:ABC-type glycerol-3-phosphate transport system substrate-binding protein